MGERRVPVLYLDIDGTVRQGKDDDLGRFVNGPEDVVVFPEAVEMMRRWKAAGGRVSGVSNQGGIALGFVTFERVAAAMQETQRQCDGLFDQLSFCTHHPDADDPEMARCWCRKPSAGAVAEAAHGLARMYAGIGRLLHRDHSTIYHGVRRWEGRTAMDRARERWEQGEVA